MPRRRRQVAVRRRTAPVEARPFDLGSAFQEGLLLIGICI